jgi:hypothetical protein
MKPNLKTFTQLVNEGNGASYNLRDGLLNPQEGFMVSLNGREEKVLWTEDNTLAIRDYILKYGSELDVEGSFIGAWVKSMISIDLETSVLGKAPEPIIGKPEKYLFLDISINVPTLSAALKLGEANCQQAIFDCVNQLDIYI